MAKTDPELMSDRELLLELVREKRRQDKVRVIKYIEVDRTMQEINDTLIKLNTDYDSLKSNGLDILQDASDTVNGLIEKLKSFGIFGI